MATRGIRLTGGALRGRFVPGGGSPDVRPTAAQVREALFSMLGQELSGWRVLDAFGGTGSLSFEALSRGAASSLVIERDPRQVRAILAAARALDVSDRIRVLSGPLARRAPRQGDFDLVLVDPPYEMEIAPSLQALAPLVGGWLVLEYGSPGPEVPGLTLDRVRRYGGTTLTLYQPTRP